MPILTNQQKDMLKEMKDLIELLEEDYYANIAFVTPKLDQIVRELNDDQTQAWITGKIQAALAKTGK